MQDPCAVFLRTAKLRCVFAMLLPFADAKTSQTQDSTGRRSAGADKRRTGSPRGARAQATDKRGTGSPQSDEHERMDADCGRGTESDQRTSAARITALNARFRVRGETASARHTRSAGRKRLADTRTELMQSREGCWHGRRRADAAVQPQWLLAPGRCNGRGLRGAGARLMQSSGRKLRHVPSRCGAAVRLRACP